MKTKQTLYEKVTASLIEALEQGCPPWRKPWSSRGRQLPLRSCGKPYSGVNVVILWVASMAKGFSSPYWFTFKQAKDLGGFVKKGQKATVVCYYSTFSKTVETNNGETEEKNIPFLRSYLVFNASQCEGLPEKYYPAPVVADSSLQFSRNPEIDGFISSLGADIRNIDCDRAYYSPSADYVNVPSMLDFINAERYYGTLCHELVHWTGHEKRLNRKISTSFGSSDYAREELCAELGAAFLCASFGFGDVCREDHAGYLNNWLSALKNDTKFIFKAASHAQKANDFLHKISKTTELLAA